MFRQLSDNVRTQISQTPTERFCTLMRESDGRSDVLKKSVIKTIQNSINMKDAAIVLRALFSNDWRRISLRYKGESWNLLELDYMNIVQAFWDYRRRTLHEYTNTYVVGGHMIAAHPTYGENWTFLYFSLGDTFKKVHRWAYRSYSFRYKNLPTETFIIDREIVRKWLLEWRDFESVDARISIKFSGEYGNFQKTNSSTYFDYDFGYY